MMERSRCGATLSSYISMALAMARIALGHTASTEFCEMLDSFVDLYNVGNQVDHIKTWNKIELNLS